MHVFFSLDPDVPEKTGCEVAALSEHLKAVFGWQARTTGVTVARIPFKVNPHIDLKSAGLLDMVATKAIVAEKQIKVPLTTGRPDTSRQLTVDEVFESLELRVANVGFGRYL